MNEGNAKTSLHITKLTINDCLGCKNDYITFPEKENVHLLLFKLAKTTEGEPSPNKQLQTITPVGQALKLLCTMEYATAASLQHLPLLQIGKGYVKMSFKLMRLGEINTANHIDSDSDLDMEPCTSKQAHERQQLRTKQRQERRFGRHVTYEVTVVRRFDDVHILDSVMIQFSSGHWQQFSFADYHGIFFTKLQHTPELLDNVHKKCLNNWLNIIQADADCYSKFKSDGNPFETFAKLFNRSDYEQQELMEKLTTHCLAANETMRLTERRLVLQIFEQVRQIFEFITVNEYTVWFFVPRLNRYTHLDLVNLDDFDLQNVRTSIKLSSDTSTVFWHHADHNIMDILLVAFQMALAKASNQSVLFLGRLEKLAECINLQYVKAFFMNNFYAKDASSPKWICKRYLNRIIEVSNSLDLIVIIEYPCGLTLLPENRPVIKCIQQHDESYNSYSWQVFEDVTKRADSGVEHLKKIMKFN